MNGTIQKTKPRIERNRVLVTGGAGFVGSHLCTFLVERGDHVRTLLLLVAQDLQYSSIGAQCSENHLESSRKVDDQKQRKTGPAGSAV